ncbi:hypothetical protein ACFRCI_23515 [Streptomyces sp. NPDC056638]|uniref:hypothetical protein n=1 Tax=Streptomyces sp. NPDC056638 TaxID=3345887 RepID=UPI003680535F
MSMADLVALGAPELPADYFYRLRLSGLGILRVTIRRQCRVGSRFVAEALAVPHLYPNPGDTVVKACREAVRDMRDRPLFKAREAAARGFIGDHDPRGGR